MATIREWLNENNFDWESGRIIYQKSKDERTPGWGKPIEAKEIWFSHHILDHDFDDGFGGPECPSFIAEDKHALYFPTQYDGATGIEKVYKNLDLYLDFKNYPTPYPGG